MQRVSDERARVDADAQLGKTGLEVLVGLGGFHIGIRRRTPRA